MNTFEWENGTVIERPYVEIDGVKHYVEDGEVSGGTPATANNLNEMQTILGGNFQLKGKLLWTNPNPNVPFLPQEITLSSGDYDMLEFFYRSDMTGKRMASVKCLKGYSVQFDLFSMGIATRRWGRRLEFVSDTQYSVGDAIVCEQGQSTQVLNEQCVPLYVIGYKTGLFGGQS